MSNHFETIVIPSSQVAPHHEKGFFSPDMNMVLLTWVTFFLLLAVLYRFAWKPILSILDAREESIRKSLEDVDRIKNELESLDAKCSQLIADADSKAAEVIDQSRKAAKEAANIIQNKAREEAQISLENALRDIKEETQKARVKLREESVQIAVGLASKLIKENMSADKNRLLIDRFIKKI